MLMVSCDVISAGASDVQVGMWFLFRQKLMHGEAWLSLFAENGQDQIPSNTYFNQNAMNAHMSRTQSMKHR